MDLPPITHASADRNESWSPTGHGEESTPVTSVHDDAVVIERPSAAQNPTLEASSPDNGAPSEHEPPEEVCPDSPDTELNESAENDFGPVLARLDEITGALTKLDERLSIIERSRTEKEHLSATNRAMQERLTELQKDVVKGLLKPVYTRLASLQAKAETEARALEANGSPHATDFSFYAEQIEDLLSLFDIESVEAAPGQDFDPAKHHAERAVKTHDIGLDKKVSKVVRQGYAEAGADRTLLPARVTVYRYEAEPHPETESAAENQNTDHARPSTNA